MTINSSDGQVCAAWVNFNGSGSIAIRDDFNVSSLTDHGTGDYTVNFSSAMSNSQYSAIVSCMRWAGSSELSSSIYGFATSSVRVLSLNESSGGNHDTEAYCVAIFGGN